MIKNFYNALNMIPSAILCILSISIIGMNLLANKSVDTGLEWLGMDAGILFSALSFLAMDIITQSFGLRVANYASAFALVFSLLMSLLFCIASFIPGTWAASYSDNGEIISLINDALNSTFKGQWYIIVGSSIAFLVSSLLNNFLNNTIGIITKNKTFGAFALRTYISTFIAQFIDNMIFSLLVSKIFFSWSLIKCLNCSIIGALLELLFEIFLSPIGYKITRYFNSDTGKNTLKDNKGKLIG